MKTVRFTLVVSISLGLTLALAGRAAAVGWSPMSWNPFSKKDSQATSATIKKRTTTATGTSSSKSSAFQKPLVVSKVQDKTKKLFTGSKTMLSPKKKLNGSAKGTAGFKSAASDGKPTGLKALFMREQEPAPPPKTIKEWMALKQVKP